jgi:transcriptional regulator with XRE-family HTH domain
MDRVGPPEPSEIRVLRRRLGETQAQFADRFSVNSQSSVANWERGRTRPGLEDAMKLWELLRDILPSDDTAENPENGIPAPDDPGENSFVEAVRKIEEMFSKLDRQTTLQLRGDQIMFKDLGIHQVKPLTSEHVLAAEDLIFHQLRDALRSPSLEVWEGAFRLGQRSEELFKNYPSPDRAAFVLNLSMLAVKCGHPTFAWERLRTVNEELDSNSLEDPKVGFIQPSPPVPKLRALVKQDLSMVCSRLKRFRRAHRYGEQAAQLWGEPDIGILLTRLCNYSLHGEVATLADKSSEFEVAPFDDDARAIMKGLLQELLRMHSEQIFTTKSQARNTLKNDRDLSFVRKLTATDPEFYLFKELF